RPVALAIPLLDVRRIQPPVHERQVRLRYRSKRNSLLIRVHPCHPWFNYSRRYFPTSAATVNSTIEIGTKICQQNFIIWSNRRRGSVHRIHMSSVIITLVFSTNHIGPGRSGPCQPPRKSVTASPAEKKLFANSARKKSANRMPE